MSANLSTNEASRKYVWDYFQMHSSQRLTTFNFYIVISSVVTTALFATFQKDYKVPFLGVPLGLLLSLLSFIFWKIDVRNRYLIKGAENALKFFESTSELKDERDVPHVTKIFKHEEYTSKGRKANSSLLPWSSYYSYSNSFNRIFLAYALTGLIGAIVAGIKFF